MQITNTTAETPAMMDPRLIERALLQTWRSGSEYCVVPFHSYEAWVNVPGSEFIGSWHEWRDLCWDIDSEWDDELILFCLKPKGHEGEHGKPGHRQLSQERVE